MALNIAYFAWVRERMGLAEEAVEVPVEVSDVAALIGWLAARDERGARAFAEPHRIRVAIDGAMAGQTAQLCGVREVALFPPVTGG